MRNFLWIPIVFSLAAGCKKEKPATPEDVSVSKKIEFHVFARDYSSPAYSNVTAELRLQVRRINYRTGESELLWDSVFASRRLAEYPQHQDMIVINKFYPVVDSKQKLNASYSIIYNWDGMISQLGEAEDLVPGETSVVLETDL